MRALIWATTGEVSAYRATEVAADPNCDWPVLNAVEPLITRAARALTSQVWWWPPVDPVTDRAIDPAVRALLVVAVAETIRHRLVTTRDMAALGGVLPAAVLAAGGSVSAGSLSVSGGGRPLSTSGVPVVALEALTAAGVRGGSVASW